MLTHRFTLFNEEGENRKTIPSYNILKIKFSKFSVQEKKFAQSTQRKWMTLITGPFAVPLAPAKSPFPLRRFPLHREIGQRRQGFYEAISHAHTCSPTKSSQHHLTKTHRHSLSGFYLISYLVFVYVISHLLTANCLLRVEFKFWFYFLKPFPSFRVSRNVQFNFCNFKQISSLAKRNIRSEKNIYF